MLFWGYATTLDNVSANAKSRRMCDQSKQSQLQGSASLDFFLTVYCGLGVRMYCTYYIRFHLSFYFLGYVASVQYTRTTLKNASFRATQYYIASRILNRCSDGRDVEHREADPEETAEAPAPVRQGQQHESF